MRTRDLATAVENLPQISDLSMDDEVTILGLVLDVSDVTQSASGTWKRMTEQQVSRYLEGRFW